MCYYCKQTIRADIYAQGYCGLGSTVKTLGLGSDEPVEVDYIVGTPELKIPFMWDLTRSSAVLVHRCRQQRSHGCFIQRLQRSVCHTGGCRPRWLLTRRTGDSGMMEYEARTGKQKKNKGAPPGANQEDFKEHMRVYFPSRDTVRTSRGGMNVSCRNAPEQTLLPLYPASSLQPEWCFLITV